MAITCPNCGTRYNLTAAQIGPTGRSLKCARCQHQWFVSPENGSPPPQSDPDVSPPVPPSNSLGLDELAHIGQTPSWARKFGPGLLSWLAVAVALLAIALAITIYMLLQPEGRPGPTGPAPITDAQPSNLTLGNLNRELQEDGSLIILRFTGTVTNTGTTSQIVPEIRLQLLDAKGIEIDFWPAELAYPILQPGQSSAWSVRFLNPPLERIASFRAFFKTDQAFTPAKVQQGTPATPSPSTPAPSLTAPTAPGLPEAHNPAPAEDPASTPSSADSPLTPHAAETQHHQ